MSEEMWHVQIEPGEVKHLTLEQLDDMFRLDLISADTLVWQPGMEKALPLSVVAGMDDDEEEESEVMEIEPELIPEPAYSSRSAAPASTGYRASAAVSAWPAAPASASAYPSVAPAPVSARPSAAAPALASTYPSTAPAYPSAPSVPPASSGYPPVVSAYPSAAPAPASVRQPTLQPAPTAMAAVARAPIAPAMPTPDFYSPESLRPITMSDMPGLRGSSGGNVGKILIGVAIAAGLLVTLYRNDLLRPMAESAGQKSTYEKFESALGAPGFGTPQGVTQMSAMLNPAAAAAATDTGTTPSTTTTTTTTTTTNTDSSNDSDSSDDSDSTGSSTSSDKTEDLAAAVKRSQGTTSAAPVRRASGSAPAPRGKTPQPSGKGLKAYKGSEYDPMNAKL
ncbi:MAG TPA: hypothetical protein VI197_13610 [Polyangiaceae bacterium]